MTVIHISNIIMSVTSAVSFLLFLFLLFSNIHAHLLQPSHQQKLNDQLVVSNQEVTQQVSQRNVLIPEITAQEQEKMLKKQAAMDLALLALETRNMDDQKSRSQQYYRRQVNGQSNKQGDQKEISLTQMKSASLGYENYQNNHEKMGDQEATTEDRSKVSLSDQRLPTLKFKQPSSIFSEGQNYGRNELESDFVNHQQKTLYFRFVEMLAHLVDKIYRGSNATEDPSLTLQDDSIAKQPLITAPQSNSTESTVENVESTPRTLKSYTLESSNLAEDAQGLVRKRKKLYFIICIMSFGIASITLIKILEATEKRKRSQRGGIMKVPSEEYEIQQI